VSYIASERNFQQIHDSGSPLSHLQSPSKKLRSCALRPPVPLTGGGGVAFTSGTLMFLPTSLSMSNASGDDSGTVCAGGAIAGAASLKPLGGGSSGTGVEEEEEDFDDGDLLFIIAAGRGGGDNALRADKPL
jgi:hypothetical protein